MYATIPDKVVVGAYNSMGVPVASNKPKLVVMRDTNNDGYLDEYMLDYVNIEDFKWDDTKKMPYVDDEDHQYFKLKWVISISYMLAKLSEQQQ